MSVSTVVQYSLPLASHRILVLLLTSNFGNPEGILGFLLYLLGPDMRGQLGSEGSREVWEWADTSENHSPQNIRRKNPWNHLPSVTLVLQMRELRLHDASWLVEDYPATQGQCQDFILHLLTPPYLQGLDKAMFLHGNFQNRDLGQ